MWFFVILLCSVTANDYTYTMDSNKSTLLDSVKLRTYEDEIHFYLFTRKNPNQQELKISDTQKLLDSNITFHQTTKIIVHGWIATEDSTISLNNLKNSYISASDFNVIIVDWSKLASKPYKLVTSFIKPVSLLVIDFLQFLIANGFSVKNLNLIGHCLGAHVASYVGKYFRARKLLIDAITALDPAYPLFKYKPAEELLQPTDARHVEVVHTNAQVWGFRLPMGHVDFYPNGGITQPGCESDSRGLCGHNRAITYYAESITSPVNFSAIYCESYGSVYYDRYKILNMSGLYLNYGMVGMYFLKTNAKSPFAIGHPDKWSIFQGKRNHSLGVTIDTRNKTSS